MAGQYDQLRREIAEYSPSLRPSRTGGVNKEDLLARIQASTMRPGIRTLCSECAGRDGLDALTAAWWTERLSLKKH